jgi:YVTN family beta-propeller protein
MKQYMTVQQLAGISLLVFLAVAGWPTRAADANREAVGRTAENRFVTPTNQILTPAGKFVELPGMRPQALALSPDGKLLVITGLTPELVVAEPASGAIVQRVPLPGDDARLEADKPVSDRILKPDKEAQVSYTGLVFAPDGKRIYLSNVRGDIKVFAVAPDGKIAPQYSFALPAANAPERKAEIPAGLALAPDGQRLYVALNLSNKLAELDTATGKVLRTWEVGVAPYGVALAGGKAFVSNWGGRRPNAASTTGPAGRGTLVRVDPVRHIASEGSVTVLDLTGKTQSVELLTGLHASALAATPNGRHVVVANAGSDTLSVIDARKAAIVETICARQNPGDLFGAQPNALAFDKKGKRLFVCNGTQNAVAVFEFDPGESKLLGLIPVGWFPGAIVHDAPRNALYVANIKQLSTGIPLGNSKTVVQFNTKQYTGSLSLVPVPGKKELAAHTQVALANLRYPLLAEAGLPARPGQPARPVPERVGEPSVFKHVIYIIKENRTYDQVFGDIAAGNGNAELCIFGEEVTPNQHKLVREFTLLDNTYCSGILSADGHQWADTSITTDYMEKSFADFPRSYPDGCGREGLDALAYAPSGFIWDNVLAHGKTLRVYGEFGVSDKRWKDTTHKGWPGFLDVYHQFVNGTDLVALHTEPGVESLRPHFEADSVGWDLDVPDVWRARQFIATLKAFEARGEMPNFIILYLPSDHTSGTRDGSPTPAAQVADNDLAMGQVIEAVSHSKFWKETCIFAIEDDPQAGWDHVSGYRTTAYVVSPYTKRGQVVGTQYNQTSIVHTMELMLGLPPMNQLDATGTPMFDCFNETPDWTPFKAVPNRVPLDQMNPAPKKIADTQLRKDAYLSAKLPLALPDQCPEAALNEILWRAMKGTQAPYPAWAVRADEDDD